jgi:Tfp pilus assembly protein PilO
MGTPFLFLGLGQPLLGAFLGARLFDVVGLRTHERRPREWLRKCGVGLAALWLTPLPAEALRYGLVRFTIDEPTRFQSESWMWVLLSAPISAVSFAVASVTSEVTGRRWVATILGFLGTAALLLLSFALNPRDDVSTGLLFLGGAPSLLYATSAFFYAAPSIGVTRRLALPVAIALPIGFLTACAWQLEAFRDEKAELTLLRIRLSAEVENSELTAARFDEFRREVEKKEAVRTSLRRTLPVELRTEAFLEELDRLADASHVAILSSRIQTDAFDFLETAAIELELDGEEESIAELERSVLELARLVRWERKAAKSSVTTVEVTTFAMPAARRDYRNPCTDGWSSGATLFPPFVEILERSRRNLEELCEKLSKLEPIHRKVEEYRGLLAEIEELEQLIPRIESESHR